jgi:hypothetical protein
LEIRKILALVLYKFVYGVFLDPHNSDHLSAGGSTVWKYIDIVCDVLISRDKLFSKCISIPIGARLEAKVVHASGPHVHLVCLIGPMPI